MKRFLYTCLIVTVLMPAGLLAQPTTGKDPNQDPLATLRSARKALKGKSIVVRAYKPPQTGQNVARIYQTVSVPITAVSAPTFGFSVEADAVKSAFPQMPESSILAILAVDQTDKLVAKAIGDCIYAEPYQPGTRLFFRHRPLLKSLSGVNLFVDVLGNPISNAEIKVMIGRDDSLAGKGTKVLIEKTRLDGQGQLRALRSISTFRRFFFLLRHTDYEPDMMTTKPPVSGGLSISKYIVQALAKDKWCVFKDALGNPMPQADVAIFKGMMWRIDQSNLIETIKLDENSRLKPPLSNMTLQDSCFIVSHPDYGMALAEPRRFDHTQGPLAECIVPLVRKDAYERSGSIWGIVLDRKGNPVPSAIMALYDLGFVDGGPIRLAALERQGLRTITDQQGQFNLCIPDSMLEGRFPLVVRGLKYYIQINAPEVLRLPVYHGDVPSGRESTIVMGPKFLEPREFIFEDEFGPVTDPNMLQQVKLEFVYESGTRGRDSLDSWLRRAKFEQGTYYATAAWNNKFYTFEPVQLADDSPDKVVFKPAKIEPFGTIYRGQVIHGVTGQPISDAFVTILPHFSDFNIDDGDDDMLVHEAIHQIGPEFGFDDPLFELLKEEFKSKMISITDADGNFQLVVTKDQMTPRRNIIVTKKDFLGAQQQFVFSPRADANGPHLQDLPGPDGQNYVTIPPLKLFPAGTIIIEPNLPVGPRTRRIRLNWFNFPGDKPTWFDAMGDYIYSSKNNDASIFRKKDLLPNAIQKFYVASDLEMAIELSVVGDSSLDPIVLPAIILKQGEVLNIGKVGFGPALKVMVMVVDSTGQPIESVTVRHFNEKGCYQGRHGITDVNGTASLDIPRYSSGELVVEKQLGRLPDGSWQMPLREGVSYKVAGEENVGKVFILHLTDEFLKILFE